MTAAEPLELGCADPTQATSASRLPSGAVALGVCVRTGDVRRFTERQCNRVAALHMLSCRELESDGGGRRSDGGAHRRAQSAGRTRSFAGRHSLCRYFTPARCTDRPLLQQGAARQSRTPATQNAGRHEGHGPAAESCRRRATGAPGWRHRVEPAPPLAVFAVLQRSFIQGLTVGALRDWSGCEVQLYLTYCRTRCPIIGGQPGRPEPRRPSRYLRALPGPAST